MAWSLHHKQGTQSEQVSFIGGKPRLPAATKLPACRLCGAAQTFFFQIAMPDAALWAGSTVAVFHCTKCVNAEHLIPAMIDANLSDADIPDRFLENYQSNFSFVVFPTRLGELVGNYKESIIFSEIRFVDGEAAGSFGKVGGAPDWLLEDETPATYGGVIEMAFLFEIVAGFQFKMSENAEPQIELDIMGEPALSPLDYYQLFIGNALYFFGTSQGNRLVYAITQI